MSNSVDLFKYDAGYYEYIPELWMCGKFTTDDAWARFSREAVDAAVSAQLWDTDVLVATYPKTGTTWTLTLLHLMKHADDVLNGRELPLLEEDVPFVEVELQESGALGAQQLAKLPSPRVIKTHLPASVWKDNLRKNPNVKIINVIRNPEDTIVSYYHHYKNDPPIGLFTGSFNDFFELAIKGQVCWGDIFDHYVGWYNFLKKRESSLILKYEYMKKDLERNVKKISSFLNYDLSEEALDAIVEKATFKNLKKDPKLNQTGDAESAEDDEKFANLRKGVVGDWENYFSEEQSQFIDAKCKEHLEPIGLRFEYN